jgi:hypothetical protein
LAQTIRFCANGNAFVALDSGLDWFHLEQYPPRHQYRGPVPVLDENRRTIAGVQVGTFHEIVPPTKRSEIERAIRNLTFHMKYTRPINEEREHGKFDFFSS